MPYITHKLGKTFYQARGRSRGGSLPLVCLHGGPGGHSRRMAALLNLASDRRVFLYDQLGGGRSSPSPQRHWNIGTFVRELDLLADAWGLDEFHLFGVSWGTTLALEYVLKRKRRVRSLVFQSPMFSAADWSADADRLVKRLPAETQKVIHYCHEIGATDAAVYQQAMWAYYQRHVCRDRTRLDELLGGRNPNGAKIYAHMWGPSEFKATGTLARYDKVRRLADVTKPSLVICGQHDEAQPATGKRYAKRLPRGQFVEIRGASHSILVEKPAAMVDKVGRFLRAND